MPRVERVRLWRGGKVTNHLSRLRYFRGHGVHSPYVYSIMRNVFMARSLQHNAVYAFDIFKEIKMPKHVVIELANLATHCRCKRVAIDSDDHNNADMIICTSQYSDIDISKLYDKAQECGTAIAILEPYKRMMLCNSLLEKSCSSSIDRFSYLILLNNHLPKQHFRL